ncbi:HD-GYP domain-containing protein [Ectobacillus polymachus]|uniref:HD-GYP domain-containing protein n=1 Tax=Ectobacillus polymachus TaxID=1508806 RepID=UPI003A8567EF
MNEMMNRYGPIFLILALLFAVFACILLIVVRLNKKKHKAQMNLLQSLIFHIKPALGTERNLDFILLKLQALVEAPNYAFYIYNATNQHYTLKAVRQLTSDMKIAPSYSGLLPYEKETFEPPLELQVDRFPSKSAIVTVGEVPVLAIPIKGEKGLIHIGPIKTLSKKQMKLLDELGMLLDVPLANLLEEEAQKRNYEVLETSAKAVKWITRLFVHEVEYLKLLIQNCTNTIHPLSCLLFQTSASLSQVAYAKGISQQSIQTINKNSERLTSVIKMLGEKPYTIVSSSSPIHSQLKDMLNIHVGQYMGIAQFMLLEKRYVLLFSFDPGSEKMEKDRNQHIKTLMNHIQQFIKIKQTTKQVSLSYIELLKSLADMMDQMSPYTVGYSKLMSRYSIAIARQMGLSEFHVQSVGLAAYLSNIGTIGLSDGLLNKEGKYSDEEYEQMKLHSEVGAAIIENTIAQEEVALYVKYHHERMDGNGYPSRLVGEEIPVGARILAVVQTFLAKIKGRSYRDPLPFDDALELLQKSAGSQLDSEIVSTFIHWYTRKRVQLENRNKALGNCWELCCTPSFICSQCPAYGNRNINCWESESNNCRAHGKTCQTCFVYTEAMGRVKKDKEVVNQ